MSLLRAQAFLARFQCWQFTLAALICLTATPLVTQTTPDYVSTYREQHFFSATDVQIIDRIGDLPADVLGLLSRVVQGERIRDSIDSLSEGNSRFRFAAFNEELVGILYETSSVVGRTSYFLISYRDDEIACRYYLGRLPARSDLTDIRRLFSSEASERPNCERRPLNAE